MAGIKFLFIIFRKEFLSENLRNSHDPEEMTKLTLEIREIDKEIELLK